MVCILWWRGGVGVVQWPRELHFSHGLSNWSFADLSSTTFQKFPCISDLFTEVPKFQHQTNRCSKCSTSLASSLNLGLISWLNDSYPYWMLLLTWQIRVRALQISVPRCCKGPSFGFILVCTGTARNRQRFAHRRPIWRKELQNTRSCCLAPIYFNAPRQ